MTPATLAQIAQMPGASIFAAPRSDNKDRPER